MFSKIYLFCVKVGARVYPECGRTANVCKGITSYCSVELVQHRVCFISRCCTLIWWSKLVMDDHPQILRSCYPMNFLRGYRDRVPCFFPWVAKCLPFSMCGNPHLDGQTHTMMRSVLTRLSLGIPTIFALSEKNQGLDFRGLVIDEYQI